MQHECCYSTHSWIPNGCSFFFFLDELNDLRLVHPLWKLVRARKASLLPCEAMRTNADLCVAPGIIECVRQKKRTTQKKRAPITLKADCSFVCLVQKRTFKIGSWKNATSEFQKTSITLSYEWRFCATLLFISLSPPLRERNGFFFLLSCIPLQIWSMLCTRRNL